MSNIPPDSDMTPEPPFVDKYLALADKLAQEPTVRKGGATSTTNGVSCMYTKLSKYCTRIKQTLTSFLDTCKKHNIIAFFTLVLDHYKGIKAWTTLDLYHKRFHQLRRRQVGSNIHAAEMKDTTEYLRHVLAPLYKLCFEARVKPVVDVDDLYALIEHHWVYDTYVYADERQRVQLAWLVLISAYTATRPGALVYNPSNEKISKAARLRMGIMVEIFQDGTWNGLTYQAVKIFLVSITGSRRHCLFYMEINLNHLKGCNSATKPKNKIFGFTEVDILAFDPIMLFLQFAVQDGAFLNTIKSMKDLFNLRPTKKNPHPQLRWKDEWLHKPICREPVRTVCGPETSSEKGITYSTYRRHLNRLGEYTGFEEILNGYCLRRGAGNAVELATPWRNSTEAELQQVMNHRHASIYQAYINEHVAVHVQNAFLGLKPAQDIMNEFNTMGRRRDPQAPTDLTEAERESLRQDPSILKLRDEVKGVRGVLKDSHIDGVERKTLEKRKEELGAEVHRTRVALFRNARRVKRKEYFDTVDFKLIENQLSNPGWVEEDDCEPLPVTYQLPEREAVARCLFEPASKLDEEADFERRKNAMLALEALMQRREPPRAVSQRHDQQSIALPKVSLPEARSKPLFCPNKCCLFCMANKKLTLAEQRREFKSAYSAQRHARRVHLHDLREDEPQLCPDEACKVTLDNFVHFRRHAADVHWYFL